MASALGGGVLLMLGIARGSLSGLALAATGGGLIYRALTGHCALYQATGISTVATPPANAERVYRLG